MCNCTSYNWQIGRDEQALLILPKWCNTGRKNRKVCIDKCIVKVIKTLWELEIETLGSCCGHNKLKPSVVIGDSENPEKIFGIIEKIDDRDWIIRRWELAHYYFKKNERKVK